MSKCRKGFKWKCRNSTKGRLNSYIADKDPIEMQRAAPDAFTGLIEGAPRRPPEPAAGKWSARAILAHLTEDELASSWRYRQMIEHNDATLLGFDQDEWARLGNYESRLATEALSMFRLLREANLRMLGTLTAEEWQRHGFQAERGRMTVEDLARDMTADGVNQHASEALPGTDLGAITVTTGLLLAPQ